MATARSHRQRNLKRGWQIALATGVVLFDCCQRVHSTEWATNKAQTSIEQSGSNSTPIHWRPVKAEPSSLSQKSEWQEITNDQGPAPPKSIIWTPVKPRVAAEIEEKIEVEALSKTQKI